MNRKACLIAILFFVYQLVDSMHNKPIVISAYNFIGILILTFALVWDIIQSRKKIINEKGNKSFINFAFLYYLLGIQIENLLTYIGIELYLGVFLYIEGTLAFGILLIYEFIKFFGMIKINLKWLYFIIFTIEIIKLIIMIMLNWSR